METVDPVWRIAQNGIDIGAMTSIRDQPILRWYMFNTRDYPDFLQFARQANPSLANDLLARYREVSTGGLDESERGVIPPNSRTAQHFYYLLRIVSLIGERPDLKIAEIGGGYGNLLRMFVQLGYCKSFSIVDIDKVSQVQRMYIRQALDSEQLRQTELFNIEDTEQAKALATKSYDLVISTFAVTETPDEMRDWYIDNLMSDASFIYITGQESWRGYQNGEHFPTRLGAHFDLVKTPFVSDHSHDGPTFELFGQRKSQ